ncbi:MAG: putative ABC transporter permease [Clostridia bacterium]|nr:putative ABC transporter permease [Clostridia bacterium]
MIWGYSFYELICLFFIYAFLGWCIEVIFCGLEEGHFINRGFLNGPVCPIYGVGGVTVILCLTPISGNIPLLFVGSAILTSFLELVTGFALDKIFHARWWDYSDMPFNIGGYICLKFSVYWGLVCIALMKGIHPVIFDLVHIVPKFLGVILIIFLSAVFITDCVITVMSINKLSARMRILNEIAEKIHAVSDEIGEHVYDGAAAVANKGEELRKRENVKELKEKYTNTLKERHLFQHRIVKAFPNMKSRRYEEHLEKLKEKLKKK